MQVPSVPSAERFTLFVYLLVTASLVSTLARSIVNVVEMLLVYILLVVRTLAVLPPSIRTEESVHNANHIFNAIHSSMRQWGSSWNHNGMSFFLATIPQHTLLYHGAHSPEPVSGAEWLAFEPEHALWFINSFMKYLPEKTAADNPLHNHNQAPLKSDTQLRGWLHTYAANSDLRLLYVDGMSAGKTAMGTLDTQDRILFNDTIPDFHNDYARLEKVCKLFDEKWGGRIDGLLRMEMGFEIIFCDFPRRLRRVNVVRGNSYPDGGFTRESFSAEMWRWYKVIAQRYGGIGGGRVRLNYDHFVTAYTYPELDLFKDGAGLPRLKNLSLESLEPMKRDLQNLVMEHDALQSSYNWQDVTDMVVTRYANDLKYLVSTKPSTVEAIHLEIERLLLPFIDFDNRDQDAEISRCVGQFHLTTNQLNTTLASRAIRSVSATICSTLLSSLDLRVYDDVITSIQGLIDYLAWTVWNECPQKCTYNEVCFVPIWPIGTVEDRENPRCWDRLHDDDKGAHPYWDWNGV